VTVVLRNRHHRHQQTIIGLPNAMVSPRDSATSSSGPAAMGNNMLAPKRYLTASVGALSAAILFLLIAITARSVAMPGAATNDIILDLRTSLKR
jgi:hypothetical protein